MLKTRDGKIIGPIKYLAILLEGLTSGKGKMSVVQKQGGVLNSDGLVTAASEAKGISSAAFGVRCIANGDSSLAGGYCSETYQVGSVAFGSSIAGNKELQEAFQNTYDALKAENPDYTDEQIYALIDNTIKGYKYGFAFAVGSGSEAKGRHSFAGGYLNKAKGNQSAALGRENEVAGENSTSIGAFNKVDGTTSFATGHTNEASSESTLCSGYKNKASQPQAAALGRENEASGGQSLATGLQTKASGMRAISGGEGTQASGRCAVALGMGTVVSGVNSLGIGNYLLISGQNALACGEQTIVEKNNQIACGKCNVAENKPFVIGNGSDANNRKNIFSVDWGGNIKGGNITIGSTTLTESQLQKLLALI